MLWAEKDVVSNELSKINGLKLIGFNSHETRETRPQPADVLVG